jgi:hypothetical protein
MPERNDASRPALVKATLNGWLEAVRQVSKVKGPMSHVTQLGSPIPKMWEFCMWDFWLNIDQAETEVQPAELIESLPWREVGWIFRQGQCIAIEGKGPDVRARIEMAR